MCWARGAPKPLRASWHDRVGRACPCALPSLRADRIQRFLSSSPASRSCRYAIAMRNVSSAMSMPERGGMCLTERSQNPNSDLPSCGFLHDTVVLTIASVRPGNTACTIYSRIVSLIPTGGNYGVVLSTWRPDRRSPSFRCDPFVLTQRLRALEVAIGHAIDQGRTRRDGRPLAEPISWGRV